MHFFACVNIIFYIRIHAWEGVNSMKRKLSTFALIGVLAATALSAVVTINTQQTTPVNAEGYADNTSEISGVFERVVDINSIADGEDLLVVADGNKTFQYLVGASYHYWMTTEFSEFTERYSNNDFIYANKVKGELVTFDKNSDGSYYLRLKHFVDNANGSHGAVKSGYIVHEAYNNSGVTAFGDLYFRESKDKPSQDAARWNVTKDQYGHTTITSKTGRQLHWKQCGGYSWSSFIATPHTEWSSNVELYRKLTVSNTIGTGIIVDTPATKQTYKSGDAIDLSGLSVTASFPSGLVLSASYDEKPYLFTPVEVSTMYGCVFFDFCGARGRFDITVDNGLSEEHKYLRSDAKILDPRGTYILGVEGGLIESHFGQSDIVLPYTFVLNLATRNIDPNHSTDYVLGEVVPLLSPAANTNPITDLKPSMGIGIITYSEIPEVVENRIEIVLRGSKYYLKSSKYGNFVYSDSGSLKHESTFPGETNAITIDSNNHILTHNSQDIFVVDKNDNKNIVTTVSKATLPNDRYVPLELFKLQITSNLTNLLDDLNGFRNTFYTYTSNYKNGVSRENWLQISQSFGALSSDLQGFLASITYNHNQEETRSFNEMMDIYDYIIMASNGERNDFINRGLAGTLINYRNVEFNCENCTIEGQNRAYHSESYTAQININSKTMHYPETIEVLMGDNALSSAKYTYNNETGAITINANAIVDDIVINAIATRYAYLVKYVRNTPGFATYFEESVNIESTTYALRSPTYTSLYIPEGKEFKCWLVDSEEVNPGETITLTDDVTITPVFKEMKAIEELNYRETVSSLSYDYEVLGENSYSFSNVVLRFGGLISKSSWDQLDNTFRADEQSRGILGYGILIYTNKLGDFEQLTPSNATYDLFVDTANKEHPNVASDSVKTANHIEGEDFNNLYYTWNLRVNVAEANFTSDITAVAYVKTATNGYMYFGQITTSVKKQANEMLLNRGYADEDDGSDDYDGSLVYLAGL